MGGIGGPRGGAARTVVVIAILMSSALVAGCVGPGPASDSDEEVVQSLQIAGVALACTDPCERPVAQGFEKSFEPDVAISPLDSTRVVVVDSPVRTERSGLASRGFAVHVSTDAGASFETTWTDDNHGMELGHPLARCAVLADAVVTFTSDGTLIVSGIAGSAAAQMSVFVMRSFDGGAIFSEFQWVANSDPAGCADRVTPPGNSDSPVQSVDKQEISAGPNGEVLLTYMALEQGNLDPILDEDFEMILSTDHGASWYAPVAIENEASSFYGGYTTVAGRDHYEMTAQGIGYIWYLETVDGGETWNATKLGRTSNQFAQYARHEGPDGVTRAIAWADWRDNRHYPTLSVLTPGAENWTHLVLLDEEPTSIQFPFMALTVDNAGVFYAVYTVGGERTTPSQGPGGPSQVEQAHRLARAYSAGVLSDPLRLDTTPMERSEMTPADYGHYLGIAAFPEGAFTVWGAGSRQVDANLYGASLQGVPQYLTV